LQCFDSELFLAALVLITFMYVAAAALLPNLCSSFCCNQLHLSKTYQEVSLNPWLCVWGILLGHQIFLSATKLMGSLNALVDQE